MSKWVVITPHQGLGDHLLCNGLYRQFAKFNDRVFLSVKRKYHSEITNMLRDVENVTLLKMPNFQSWKTTRVIQRLARIMRIRVVGLGSYGIGFFPQGVRFDNNFYDQGEVDFKHRWDSFHVPRNHAREFDLFNLLGCQKGKYIFLHEDNSRNFTINRDLLPKGYRVISPISDNDGIFLVDYRLVIEEAFQVHVIESSFAAFIESIDIDIPLFAHRYARNHALHDFRHEFTYRKPWQILI